MSWREYTRRLGSRRQRWSVAFYWACRSIWALLLALPAATAIDHVASGFPSGDAALFRPGAMLLLDVLRQVAPTFSALGSWSLLWLSCWVVLSPLPLSAVLVAQQDLDDRDDFDQFVARTCKVYTRQLLLELITWLAWLALVLAWLAWMSLASSVMPDGPNERREDLVAIALTLPFVALAAWVRPWLDLSKVAQASGQHVLGSLVVSWRCARRRAFRVVGSWSAPALLGMTLFLLATHGSLLLSARTPSSTLLAWLGVLLGQAGYLCLTLARGLWLSRAAAWIATARAVASTGATELSS